jgi:DNA processing protein
MSDGDLIRLAWCGLSPRKVSGLIERYGSVSGAVDAISTGSLDLGPTVRSACRTTAEQRYDELVGIGATFVARGSSGYPPALDRFPGSPPWLFVVGEIPDMPSVAIVGTRSCTTYGSELAHAYGSVATDVGWSVVSGLARGIDRAAHVGAVAAGGRCSAIFGSGIDVIYPRRHRSLVDDILASGGCTASEYPPGTRPDSWRFPTRNRIIAGLSDVVIVVEAGATGGALITARMAVDFGIPVFATPGDVDRPASIGTNLLIRDGAFPIFDPDDLAKTLDLIVPFARARQEISA